MQTQNAFFKAISPLSLAAFASVCALSLGAAPETQPTTQPSTQPTAVGSVAGKIFVTSAGDCIRFWDNGIAVEINGEFGVAYAGQAIYFGEDGRSPRTQCPYKQDGAKITMTVKVDGTTAVFTVNEDGTLTGPSEGIWGHKAFAHMTLMNK